MIPAHRSESYLSRGQDKRGDQMDTWEMIGFVVQCLTLGLLIGHILSR